MNKYLITIKLEQDTYIDEFYIDLVRTKCSYHMYNIQHDIPRTEDRGPKKERR